MRETEALVKSYHEGTPAPAEKTPAKSSSFNVAQEEQRTITEFFGAKVDVKVDGKGKGKITIPFSSQEDFNRIIKLIKG